MANFHGDSRLHFTANKWGYIKTGEDMMTSIESVYAVGDLRSKKYRHITTAVADGTIAAIAVTESLSEAVPTNIPLL